ncbi:hypothetical protein EDB81DRAFT_331158 [Dactylonectria macrodidyma]|uniref:Atos-like conserved domain-containing protein n=1 Tax=Dactylonectria macrodidyma TaxID=307937 RepID=A0A9P9JGQ1_9HYPO|nr:hypothetical protein EDB81DRAFT_331158 [Dactylonectria macrodidyma]
MPIFQDDLDHHSPADRSPIDVATPSRRRLSDESIRTELCEGLIPDSPRRPKTPRSDDALAISDRVALIERLKRAQSPTWIPNRHLESILQHTNHVTAPKRPQTPSESSSLLPPAKITPEKLEAHSDIDERLRDGLSIQRPRSALHSGDFTEEEAVTDQPRPTGLALAQNHPALTQNPWIATSPPRAFASFQFERRIPLSDSIEPFPCSTSPLSSSLSSSFVYQPPTSPLVQSESYEELDLSMPLDGIDFSSGRVGAKRYIANSAATSPFPSPSPRYSLPPRISSYRRESSFPYQAHQPRRSLTSIPSFVQGGTSPQTPAFLRSRRSSFVSDSSPLHHASMVGSYEESILRGRMSTTPSKPLDFVAQIGVLGKGKCKSSLKCPAHVSLSFPAVYYSYGSTPHGRSSSEDGPSPYVGQIDLENGLPNPEDEQRSKRKAQSRYVDRKAAEEDVSLITSQSPDRDSRRNSRAKRKSGTPKVPPGGSYRIPETGQIQIIIKNPNKTAVKLFLVPYDLSEMEPGTKTFIRQRSYSAGPIIDNVPATSELDSMDRPILRYLVHLHICSPAKGRFYLYKSIRIVFANRVPDGKEKLHNETTWPEPRYTPYKPIRVMHPLTPVTGPGAMLAAEKAWRRRSAGFPLGTSSQAFDMMDEAFPANNLYAGASSGDFTIGNTHTIDPVPFCLPGRDRVDSDVSDITTVTAVGSGIRSPSSSQASRPSTQDSYNNSSVPWGPTQYEKLNKGDLGYGGNAFALAGNGSTGGAEGLLSQRLRSLGVKQPPPPHAPSDTHP